MSEKSGWFGHILGKSSAKPLPTSAKRCPNGHPMALDWRDCPYCKAAESAAERTRFSQAGGPSPTRAAGSDGPATSNGPAATAAGTGTPRRQTKVDAGAATEQAAPAGAAAGRRHTSVLDTDDPQPQPPVHSGGGRRLTGIVFTFSWSKLGQLFDIRDGRNYVGSGVVSSEGNRPVDVLVTQDEQLSSAHFLILCQGEKYRIRDVDSTNGTFVNGTQIDTLGIDLEDGSLIQAGTTLFAFQKVRPPAPPARDIVEAEPDPDPVTPPWPGNDRERAI